MKVRVLREHSNAYGAKPVKSKGDEYELPDNAGQTLVDLGWVEEPKEPAKAK